MGKLFRLIADAPHRLMAAAATVGFTALNTQAHAAGVGDLANTVQQNFTGLGKFVIAGGFLGGVGLSAAGLMKLKAASDSGGQQVKYSEGLWRLGIGGCLCALPAVTGVGVGTFFPNSGTAPTMETGTTFTN